MKLYVLIPVILASFLVAGCHTKMRDYGYRKPYDFASKAVRKYKFNNTSFRTNYDSLLAQGKEGEAQLERNQILSELIYVIETEHGDYERMMRFNHTAWSVVTDFALLGLTGAATVAGGAETKTILSAIATGVQGAELSVNKRIFQDQALQALQAQMRAAQEKKKAEIIGNMKEPVSTYPLELGLSDIVQFYHEGTMTRAFENLVATAKEKEASGRKEAANAKKE